ncbi:hypothetical protein Krac_4950 [Ktedonobacter racemifer DSM 44963]|uniref:Uncharacterized protein n=1 Tax=Ktedonobacter racemifer DSM 44963 TaxID=485913 RepID=D6TU45_KTERA|nr:hypothetical protein Krac_4950 [Ktedonobacter racemifer DSM 44963]
MMLKNKLIGKIVHGIEQSVKGIALHLSILQPRDKAI